MLLLSPRDPEINLAKFVILEGDHLRIREDWNSIEKELGKIKLTGNVSKEEKFWILEIKPQEGKKMTHATMLHNTNKFAKKLRKKGYTVIGI